MTPTSRRYRERTVLPPDAKCFFCGHPLYGLTPRVRSPHGMVGACWPHGDQLERYARNHGWTDRGDVSGDPDVYSV